MSTKQSFDCGLESVSKHPTLQLLDSEKKERAARDRIPPSGAGGEKTAVRGNNPIKKRSIKPPEFKFPSQVVEYAK